MKYSMLHFLVVLCLYVWPNSLPSTFADTHDTEPVGPGIIFHNIVREEGPWAIQVLEIDLTNPHVSLETIKANDQLVGRKKTSELASSVDEKGHWVVGAINGDYFSSVGVPHGVQVFERMLISDPSKWSVFGLFNNKSPFIHILSLNANVFSDEGNQHKIAHINQIGKGDELILFSNYMGDTAQISENSATVFLSSSNGRLILNDTLMIEVDSVKSGAGEIKIPENGFILNATGKARDFVQNNADVDDIWKMFVTLNPESRRITEAISGGPRIVRNGEISVENHNEGISDSFAFTRHPRTAIGFSADSTCVYFVTVDGRQPGYSVGMSLYELADFMVDLGVAEATNLDGGGSTTMVVRNEIVNRPSDKTGERPVANAILAVSAAPSGKLTYLKIKPERKKIIAGSEAQFAVAGFDRYYNPVNVDQKLVQWEIEPELGEILDAGKIAAGEKPSNGKLIGKMDDIADTASIQIVNVERIEILPDPLILEKGQTQKLNVILYDAEDTKIDQEVNCNLNVTRNIGSVDSRLVFSPERMGEGYLIARWQDVSCSTRVVVGTKKSKIIEDFEDISEWHVNVIRANSDSSAFFQTDSLCTEGRFCGGLRYQFEPGGTSAVFCNTSIPVFGEPFSFRLRVFGDGQGHWLRGEFGDKNGHRFIADFTNKNSGVNWRNEWRNVRAQIAESQPSWGNPGATIAFPITWKKIYIAETDEKKKTSGILLFDDLTAEYIFPE